MGNTQPTFYPEIENIEAARASFGETVAHTSLERNANLSEKYGANIYLKREDLQVVRSYKIRGAYNKMSNLSPGEIKNGVVCASAGNHAQGVAYSCEKLGIKGVIFMPTPTPSQKLNQVRMFGKEFIEVILIGDTFDDAYNAAKKYCDDNNSTFIHPFRDEKVIEGQGTVGLEILEDCAENIDYLFFGIGGGGLASGVSSVFKKKSPETIMVAVEPAGATSMKSSIEAGQVVTLEEIDKFVDGAAVKRVDEVTYNICKQNINEFISVPEGKICSTILQLYNQEAIVAEPAGALSISALDQYKDKIKGKTIVCLISGGNNDITRTEEIKERSLLYEGLKHYFIIRFPQRAGALKEFLLEVLGPDDDITHFEYTKKSSRGKGPAAVGLELKDKTHFDGLIKRMRQKDIQFEYLNDKPNLFQFLV